MKTGVWNSVLPTITVTLIQCHFLGSRYMSTLTATDGKTPSLSSLPQFCVPNLGNMTNDFAEGALRQISATLPKEPFCDHFTKTEVFWKPALDDLSGWTPTIGASQLAQHCLPTPPLPMALWAGICQRKCLSHGKTLLVMLLGTHVQHRPIVTAQCLSLLSHNTDFGWQLGWKQEENSLQGAAHSCRPGSRGKVLL